VNGSFEAYQLAYKAYKSYGPNSYVGWKSLNGERIEIWGEMHLLIPAVDGKNILELDYINTVNKFDHIYQDIQTVTGRHYEASFYLRSRSEAFTSPDETAVFVWNGAETSFTAANKNVWTKITILVVGTGGLDRFGIREDYDGNTSRGPLIDNVSLIPVGC
jgi:hypothetical protein